MVPMAVSAQYGPPAGFDMSNIPAGYDTSNIPSGMQGPPANLEELQKKGQEMGNNGLERMKKGVRGMQKAVDQMNKVIKKIKDAGYGVPAGVEDSLAKAVAAIATINAATEFTDEVQTALDDFNAFVDILDENMETMQMLGAFPKIKKQADREMANLQKTFDKVKIKLEKTEMDLTAAFSKVQSSIDGVKAVYDKATALAKAGNAQDAFTSLEEEFFPSIGDVRQSIGMLDALKNIARAVKSVEKGIKNAEKVVAKVKSKGADVSDLQTVVDSSRAELDKLKASLKSPDFDPTDAVDFLENLNDLRDQFEETLNDIVEENDINVKINPITFFGGQAPKMPKEMQNGFGNGKNGEGERGNGNAYGFEKLDF